jgi:hypothetical protein
VEPFIIADIIKVAFGAALLPWAQRVIGERPSRPQSTGVSPVDE